MSIQLILKNDDLNEDKLQALVQDLAQTLNRETDIQAQPVQGETVQGNKGGLIILGSLVLSFLKSGTAAALIGVLKSYLIRDSSMQFEFISHDKVIKINAKNLHDDQIEQVISSLKQLIDSETHD